MSWNAYIDSLKQHAQEDLDQGAIIGLDGSIWTTGQSNVIGLTAEEARKIADVMKGDNPQQKFSENGIICAGVKYMFLRDLEEGKVVLGKKKEKGAITLQKTGSAVVISHTKEGGQQGAVNKACNTIAQYLESQGY